MTSVPPVDNPLLLPPEIGYVQGPALPEPDANVESLRMVVSLLRETIEGMQAFRGEKGNRVLTVNDMVALGIIDQTDLRNLP